MFREGARPDRIEGTGAVLKLAAIPYWVLYVALVVILLVGVILLPDNPMVPVSSEIKDAGATTITVVNSMIGLMSTLNTTMLAAAAALAVKGRDWSDVWSRADGSILLCTFVAGSVSYYGVYTAYVALLEMVDIGYMSGLAPHLQRGLSTQYYATLAGYVLLGLVFTRMLEGRRLSKAAGEPAGKAE